MNIRPAVAADLGELFTLQRAAFVDEAWVYSTAEVPSLRESMAQMQERLAQSHTLIGAVGHRIVAMVSLRDYRPGGPDIERLAVAPDQRGRGLGSRLVTAAEDHAFDAGETAVQLIVGEAATLNRRLYERLGYEQTDRFSLDGYPAVVLLSLQKPVSGRSELAGPGT